MDLYVSDGRLGAAWNRGQSVRDERALCTCLMKLSGSKAKLPPTDHDWFFV